MLYTGNYNDIIDSFYVSTEGYFYFNNLKQNTLYRLNVIPKSSDVSGTIIQKGKIDNYTFFVTDNSKAAIYMTGDITKLASSSKLICVDTALHKYQKEVLDIQKLKLDEQKVARETNTPLLQYLQQVKNPQVLALGLIYYDFEHNYSGPGINTLVQKLRLYSNQPLITSILDRVNKISARN
jgi:uncharacterized beta-barrel protein YwiB (DUF1934 family)